ncbi:unnamed protein product [Durusdinium trenchii]|uniref:Poly(A) RNA polymerase mitochondrial-like central palm domain-containing protein n=1 Tax=Durusdinium trenchii TaxID=1381693 RepID=A0ABP0L741_9DINO
MIATTFHARMEAFTSAISACGRAAQWSFAQLLLAGAQPRGLADPLCRNALLSALGRAARWQEALTMLATLGEQSSTASWNASITACAEAAEWRSALALLAARRRSLTSDLVSFNAALAALRNASCWEKVLGLFEDMLCSKLRPDDSSLSTAVAALQRAGNPQKGLDLWNHHQQSADTASYTAALKCAADADAWCLALWLTQEMQQKGIFRSRLAEKALLRAWARAPVLQLPKVKQLLSEEDLASLAFCLEKRHHSPSSETVAWSWPSFPSQPLPAELVPRMALQPVDLTPVAAALDPTWRLWPLGSRAEGLATEDSDVDATIILPNGLQGSFEEQRELQRQTLRRVRASLPQAVRVDELVLEAKRPILRLHWEDAHGEGRIWRRGDLSVESRQGAQKSALVAQHVLLGHPALGAACAMLKSWAKRRCIYGQSHGFPSGLGFSCLGIFAAQQMRPAAAVSMELKVGEVANLEEVYEQLQRSQQRSELLEDLPRLLQGIFRFYAEDFDWAKDAVSLHCRTLVNRQPARLSIEDPVELQLDLAQPYMDQVRSDLLQREMRAAHEQLRKHRWEAFGAKDGVQSLPGIAGHPEEHLHELGRPAGLRVLDLCALRENRNRRETRLLPMLNFIASAVWTRLFGHTAELLKGQDHENEYMLNDKALLVNRFISVPRDLGDVNCGAFVAGMVEGMLCSAEFPATATAHTVDEPTGTSTTILIRFEEKVMARERRSERG